MSLLLNEEFTLYRLRLGYLNQIHDGVGERLINLNTAVLNEPAFRAAGWVADTAAIKRCYSPPIPTTGAADYFSRPSRVKDNGVPLEDETNAEQRGGLISGQLGSEDTVGPSFLTEKERRRRKQGQKIEDDDSSDLSDDSDDEDTAAQSVRFAKMPNRSRLSTSPPRPGPATATLQAEQAGPEVKVISPSYRPRTSSLVATEAINAANSRVVTRPRRDTTTSSEMSSDNEGLIPDRRFRRKLPGRPQKSAMLADKIAEEEPADESELEDEDEDEEEDVEVAEASDLSDEFEGDDVAVPSPELPIDEALDVSLEKRAPPIIPPAISPSMHATTARSSKEDLPKLPRLPPGRPMSMKPPSSLLSMALKGSDGTDTPGKPYQKYAELSGKGEAQPLWIKIYAPFSKNPDEPIQVPLKRSRGAEGVVPTVKELIGLALWRYDEEDYEPALSAKDSKVESWELRMVEDGEVDLDFPALSRDRPVTDFTSNNNRPPQRRMRDKPWDEFGLIRAESRDTASDDDEPATTVPSKHEPITAPSPALVSQQSTAPPPPPILPSMMPNRNPITGPAFTLNAATRKDSTNLMDAPQQQTVTSTPRMGPVKTVQVHFTDPQSFQVTLLPLDTTADTYIAELFEKACTRLRLDKALYVFKVKGTQTVAPSDRTVEALGAKLHLDLVRRRFGAVGDFGLGLSGSPGSSSPNAPLELVPNTPPTAKEAKRRKGFPGVGGVLHPLVAQKSEFNSTATSMLDLAGPNAGIGRRYNVMRKLPFSLTTSHPRTLIITPEYMQILPGPPTDEGGQAGGSKVTNVAMQSIVGVKVSRKHPKMMRVLVYREKETKRYDFECTSHAEAEQIVGDIRVGLSEYGVGGDDV